MVREICLLAVVVGAFGAVLSGCSDDSGSGSGLQPVTRTPLPGGRAPEAGISVVALALPEQEPTTSMIQRIEASASTASCDEDAGSDSCDGNTAPVLGKPLYEIDGMIYDELPAGIHARAEILILVPYEDAECNLACGTYSQAFEFAGTGATRGAGAAGGTPLPDNLPCGTESSGTYLGLYAPGGVELPGTYDYHLGVADACGESATGESVAGRFEVE